MVRLAFWKRELNFRHLNALLIPLGRRLLDEKRKYYRGSLRMYCYCFSPKVHSLRKIGKQVETKRNSVTKRNKASHVFFCMLMPPGHSLPKHPFPKTNFESETWTHWPLNKTHNNYIKAHLPGLIFSLLGTIQFVMDLIARKSPSDDDSGHGDRGKGVKYLVDTTPCMRVLPAEYVLPLQQEKLISSSRVAIPVIDLSGLDGSIGRRMMTVEAIGSACAHWGFFRIINHGVKVSLMEEMLKVVDGFFNLTAEEKMNYASEDVMNPVRYGTSLNTSQRHALHWRDYLRHFGHPIDNSFHLWPRNPSTYRVVAKEYLEEVWGLAIRISGAISEALGLKQDYVEKSLGEGCQIVASNYYPPCPEPHRTLGLAAHSDHGGITILMQNEVDGLQVKHQGEWVAVHHVPGTLVVNIGDYIEILSNGKYRSVEHRAVVNAERTRISIAVGHGPEMTATVAPASPLVDEKSWVKYRPIMYKDYMRAQQSSAVRGKSPLQALMTNTTVMK